MGNVIVPVTRDRPPAMALSATKASNTTSAIRTSLCFIFLLLSFHEHSATPSATRWHASASAGTSAGTHQELVRTQRGLGKIGQAVQSTLLSSLRPSSSSAYHFSMKCNTWTSRGHHNSRLHSHKAIIDDQELQQAIRATKLTYLIVAMVRFGRTGYARVA